MQLSHLLAFALSLAASEAAHKGFDYGANKADGSVKVQADFQSEFQTAKNLVGTSGFNSARLYTMIQGGSTNDPIAAIPAAIAEETSLLLGLWASGGGMDNEIAALKAAISKYGEEFTKLVVGISVGSEDLYRNSYDGVQANAGVGINPDELANYIKEVRSAIAGTSLSGASIGHVDTWTAWVNGSNSAVVDACDWLGFDGYPYFQNTMANSIEDAKSLFDEAVDKTKSVSNGKEVWITETGWPVSGDKQNLAVASKENAKTFWDEVGCPLFDTVNTWWYILQDAGSVTPNPSFGVVGSDLSTTPLFDLSCKGKSSSSSSSAAPSGTSAASSSQASGGASGSASSSGSSSSSGSGSSSSSGAGAGAGASSTSSSSRTPHITGGPLGSRPSGNAGKGASSTLIPSSSSVASSSIVVSSGAPSKTGTSSSGAGAGSSGSNSGSGSGSSSSSSAGAGASPSESSLLSNNASTMSGSILSVAVFIFALVIAV